MTGQAPGARRHDERGAGSVLALALCAVLVVVGVATAGAVALVAGHRAAQAAADLAALAGATALQDGQDPCARAAVIAARNGAELRGCTVRDWSVAVVTVVPTARALGGWELPARARAGPASALGSPTVGSP